MKLNKNSALVPIAAAVMALGSAGPAAAATWEFDFGSLITGTGPAGGSFAHLTVSSADNLTFTFDLTIGNNFNSIFGSTAYVKKLLVDTTSSQDPVNATIAGGTWGVGAVALNTTDPGNGGPSYSWDFSDTLGGGGSSPSARLIQGEEVMWTSSFSSVLSNPPFGNMGLKVQGIGSNDDSAHYLATPVPEPETYALLLAGLGLLGVAARRRKRKEAATV